MIFKPKKKAKRKPRVDEDGKRIPPFDQLKKNEQGIVNQILQAHRHEGFEAHMLGFFKTQLSLDLLKGAADKCKLCKRKIYKVSQDAKSNTMPGKKHCIDCAAKSL